MLWIILAYLVIAGFTYGAISSEVPMDESDLWFAAIWPLTWTVVLLALLLHYPSKLGTYVVQSLRKRIDARKA